MKLKTRMILAIGSVLLVVLFAAFLFIFNSQKSQTDSLYYSQAKAISDNFALVRTVISEHGGVFAKEKEGFGANPYLKDNPNVKAEMTNLKGDKLALISGFAFLNEMSKLSAKIGMSSFDFRVPSDNPLNPANKATPAEQAILEKMRKQNLKEYYTLTKDKNGQPIYMYSSALVSQEHCMGCHPQHKVGKMEGMVSILLPIAAAEARKSNDLNNIIYIFAGVVAVILGVTYWLASRITSPIKELAVAADRISKGETDVELDINRNDEIGELAGAFNRMVASIKILTMMDEDLPKTGSDS